MDWFEKSAVSIFDQEEPVGRPTDFFSLKSKRLPRG